MGCFLLAASHHRGVTFRCLSQGSTRSVSAGPSADLSPRHGTTVRLRAAPVASTWSRGDLSPKPCSNCSCATTTWASLVAQMVKNPPAVQRTRVPSWVGKIPWRREWLPTPVFWPGEFHGQRSLADSSPWGQKDSDTTEQVTLSLSP